MATEPRKPKFTNHKALNVLVCAAGLITMASVFISVFWWPPLIILAYSTALVALFLVHRVGKLDTWEYAEKAKLTALQQAQWVPGRSNVLAIELSPDYFRSMVESSRLETRQLPIKAILENGHVITLFWDLFSVAGPSYTISYENRMVNGRWEYRNVAAN